MTNKERRELWISLEQLKENLKCLNEQIIKCQSKLEDISANQVLTFIGQYDKDPNET